MKKHIRRTLEYYFSLTSKWTPYTLFLF